MKIVPRLIQQFIPENYNLSINLNRKDRLFDGIVTIHGTVINNSKKIILHSKKLKIESAIIDGKNAKYSVDENDELIISHPDINIGNHILVIAFSGKITDSMHGLYACYYEYNGVKKELLATQFESHHAREVFPCIDEPEAKATFDVTLTTEQKVTVIGNMPIKNQTVEDKKLVTVFETTPKMSSYLLAWVVGELHKKTAHTKSHVEVNVWATPAQSSESLDFALDIATRTIDFFDEYFDTPYPLTKCDHVALPDFSSGAMENWGLITYREVALLADPKTTSVSNKHYVAMVIAHELSHQWFGNLVTMKWWNDLWLNESFASLVEYTAIDALEPSWNVWKDYASSDCIYALRRDCIAGVQSVQTEVHHPDEIGTLFDGAIVYAKGSRLIQMLQNYIGDKNFQIGLKNYFKEYAYRNTEAHDLWVEFGKASGKDISLFMNKWIKQPGFPVLHVSKKSNKILLSQERLSSTSCRSCDYLWPIPLNSNCSEMPELLDSESIIVTKNSDTVLQFNLGSKAHYITHYSHELLEKLIKKIESGDLSAIDRLQLLHEQIMLADAGITSSAELIPLLEAYKNETEETVWEIISATLGGLKKFVSKNKDVEKKLKNLSSSLAQNEYNRLGWSPKINEPDTDSILRTIIIGMMLYSEKPEVISAALEIFDLNDIDNLDPELRSHIISTAVRYKNDDSLIDSLIEKYKSTNSAEIQQDICMGLAFTKKKEVVKKLLNLLKDTSIVRTQDTARWFVHLIRNKYSRMLTWQWIRDNWDWIEKTFEGGKIYDDYPRFISTVLRTNKQLNEYCDFFLPKLLDPALTRVIEMGINEIRDRIDSIKRDGEAVRKALLDL